MVRPCSANGKATPDTGPGRFACQAAKNSARGLLEAAWRISGSSHSCGCWRGRWRGRWPACWLQGEDAAAARFEIFILCHPSSISNIVSPEGASRRVQQPRPALRHSPVAARSACAPLLGPGGRSRPGLYWKNPTGFRWKPGGQGAESGGWGLGMGVRVDAARSRRSAIAGQLAKCQETRKRSDWLGPARGVFAASLSIFSLR